MTGEELPIRVLISGPSPVLVDGVSRLLGAAEALAVVGADPVDVVVHLDGTSATASTDRPAVAVSSSGSVPVDAIVAGVRAVVDPEHGPDALVDAIRCVAGGGHLLDRRHVDELAAALAAVQAKSRAPVQLTRREHDVLECVRRGKTLKETAAELGVSVKTVENTQRLLFTKLGVKTRSQAIARTHQIGGGS